MKKILIIEDDKFLGDILVEKLTKQGCEVTLSRDGAEGYEKIKLILPDLILLDVMMPNMNGYEILEKKLKDAEIAKIPVIIISNSGQPVEINRALALGVKDYLVKAQFDADQVMEKIKSQLKDDKEKPAEAKTDDTKLAGKKVMWVEDDQFLNDIIARKLSSTKCDFFHCANGEDALDIINKEKPDIILLDIILPGMDGFEILKRIKANPNINHIPVILLSNLGQTKDIDKGISLGAAKFLVKATVNLDEIMDEIKSVMATSAK